MISVNDIKKSKKKKNDFKKTCFKHILELINNKIKLVSKTESKSTFYEIPLFIIGFPIYTVEEVVEYIIPKLEKKGFEISFLNPNFLFINWDLSNNSN